MPKKDIHPKYYPKAKVKCACGNTFTIGSTKPEIETEICFNCHPFYTGKEKIMESVGQVQKFRKRMEKMKQKNKPEKKKKPNDKEESEKRKEKENKSTND